MYMYTYIYASRPGIVTINRCYIYRENLPMTTGNQSPKIEYVHIVHTHNNMCSYISEQDTSMHMHKGRLSMATWHQLQRLNTCILYICATMCVCIYVHDIYFHT